MGGNIQLPIDGGFYESPSLPLSGQRCVNWYVSRPQTQTVTDANLFGIPGLNQLATVSAVDTLRGAHEMAGIPYFVIGSKLWRLDRTVDADGVETFGTTDLGAIAGTGRVSMDDNGTQLCIVVPGGNAYIFVEPGTLTQITDIDFDGPADSVRFVDGYFNFIKTNSKKLFQSNLFDGLNYNALDFNTETTNAGNLAGQIVYNEQLYTFGPNKCRRYRNIGRDPAPFAQTPGAVWDFGLAAPFSLVNTPSSFVMVGNGVNQTPAVWQFAGNNFQKISTIAIDQLLASLSDTEIEAIFSWVYAEDGHYFVSFQLPTTTLVYDFTGQKWHERQSLDSNGNTIPYRVGAMITGYGRVLVGDTQDGRIGEIVKDLYTEYGGFIKRRVVTRPFDQLGNNMSVLALEAVMTTGAGIKSTSVTSGGVELFVDREPKLRLTWSDDGGRTFTDEIRRGLGLVGEYERRATWRRLGDFNRSRVFAFEMSDPTDPTFIKLEAEMA